MDDNDGLSFYRAKVSAGYVLQECVLMSEDYVELIDHNVSRKQSRTYILTILAAGKSGDSLERPDVFHVVMVVRYVSSLSNTWTVSSGTERDPQVFHNDDRTHG